MKTLMGYIKNYKWYMIFGPLCKMIETVLELCSPLLIANVVDHGVKLGDLSYILKYGGLIVLVNIVSFVFAIIGQKCASQASAGISHGIRKDMFNKISTFSHAELDKYGTASLINRITNDVNQIENSISIFIRLLLRVPFMLIGAFVLSLVINKKMSLIFLVLIPLVAIFLTFYMIKTAPFFKRIRTKLDRVSTVTKENLSGTRVIRAFNKQADEQKRFEVVSDDYTKTNIKVAKVSTLLEPFIFTIVDLATLAILLVGGHQINVGGMTQGDVIALIDYVAMITISLLMLSHIIVIFVRTYASVHRVDEIFKTEVCVKENPNVKIFKDLNYDAIMEFNNVCFNYSLNSGEKSFIKDLSFKIYPGQTIGIIGGTGSGKTTIASLMTRFYDVTNGEILYKGKNIKDFSLKQLRHEISIVQQRSILFSGSLRENMQLRKSNASDDEIMDALKVSQAWGFVSEWKNGLDYQILAGGKNVSGGQMQRLTIARALIDSPEMIILDDSSSALDFLTDSKLRKELKKLNSTLVFISQRATSIQNADLIIVLDNGDVVGMGKHKDLVQNCDIYREIYESQAK